MPGAQQLRAARQAQQCKQAARGEALARAERERPMQVVKQRRAQFDAVDRAGAVHDEFSVAVRPGAKLDARRGVASPGCANDSGCGMMRVWAFDARLAELLACPTCGTRLTGAACLACRVDFPSIGGIPG